MPKKRKNPNPGTCDCCRAEAEHVHIVNEYWIDHVGRKELSDSFSLCDWCYAPSRIERAIARVVGSDE